MSKPSPHSTTTANTWSVVRLLFGITQMAGVAASLVYLIMTGLTSTAITITAVTFAITVTSRLLWGGKSDNIPFRWISRHRS